MGNHADFEIGRGLAPPSSYMDTIALNPECLRSHHLFLYPNSPDHPLAWIEKKLGDGSGLDRGSVEWGSATLGGRVYGDPVWSVEYDRSTCQLHVTKEGA